MNNTERMTELLRAIRTADEQIRMLNQARVEAVAELEQLMRADSISDFSDGEYRARMVRRLRVLSAELLSVIAPELVEVQVQEVVKVDNRKLRAIWDTPKREQLAQAVSEMEVLEVGEESRKTVKDAAK